MLNPLPHPTINEYNRDFQAGTLVKFCFRNCPGCGGRVYLSLRHRIIQNIDYYRGRCAGRCGKHYSFLPQFVVFRKWYSSIEISEALTFIEQPRFGSVSAALEEWEIEREGRICEGLTAGPCRTTVYNWHKEQQIKSVGSSGSSDDSGTSHPTEEMKTSPTMLSGKLSSPDSCSQLPSINDISGADSTFGILCQLRISSFLILVFFFLFPATKTSRSSFHQDFTFFPLWRTGEWLVRVSHAGNLESGKLINSCCPEVEYIPLTASGYIVFVGIPP